jgi:hypothetical protein
MEIQEHQVQLKHEQKVVSEKETEIREFKT